MIHRPSQDQDLRTALDQAARVCTGLARKYGEAVDTDREQRGDTEAAIALTIAAENIRKLAPAQAPDKAGEREGLDAAEQAVRSHRAFQQWKNDVGYASPSLISFQAGFEAAEAALAPQPNGTEASRGVGAEGLRAAVAAYFAAFDAEPEKDCWDTETGEEEPGAQKFSSDWAHNDHMDAVLAARETLRQALAATPTPPLSPSEYQRGLDDMQRRCIESLEGWIAFISTWPNVPARDPIAHTQHLIKGLQRIQEPSEDWASSMSQPLSPDSTGPAGAIRQFAEAILHGDDEHRSWLTEAAEAFISGQPMPAPRGKGTAALTPSAPIAAPVRDEGAREPIGYLNVYRDKHGEYEVGCTDPYHTIEEARDYGAMTAEFAEYVGIYALVPLPAPAGDVPGEAQTQEGGR
jgi:hypothetical protein